MEGVCALVYPDFASVEVHIDPSQPAKFAGAQPGIFETSGCGRNQGAAESEREIGSSIPSADYSNCFKMAWLGIDPVVNDR